RLGRALVVSTERKRARLDAARLSPSLLSRRLVEARRHLDHAASRLPRSAEAGLRERRRHLATLNARMTVEPIARHAAELRREEQRIAARLRRAVDALLNARRTRFSQAERMLSTVSYQSILERGFAVVRDAEGQTIKRAASLDAGTPLSIQFADGVAGAVATGSAETPKQRPKPAPKDRSGGGQGSLF
ncbi:exodeoxyribonuclease VII large subunit, partial [Rhizobiaceae sp. 2RAB30]